MKKNNDWTTEVKVVKNSIEKFVNAIKPSKKKTDWTIEHCRCGELTGDPGGLCSTCDMLTTVLAPLSKTRSPKRAQAVITLAKALAVEDEEFKKIQLKEELREIEYEENKEKRKSETKFKQQKPKPKRHQKRFQ